MGHVRAMAFRSALGISKKPTQDTAKEDAKDAEI